MQKEIGITASIGLAATKVVAKVASDYHKPDGLTYVEEGAEKDFLAPLPIRDLPGIGPKMEIYFHRLGVKTLGEVAQLPKEKVKSFDKALTGLWQAANGADNVWYTPRTVAKSVSRSETFYTDREDEKFILAMLRKLTESVGEELREEGFSGRCVYVTIRYSDFHFVSRQRVLPSPTNITKEIYDMGETLLKELWDGRSALRLVGIGISQFGEELQPSLFEGARNKRLGLEKRIDKLKNKFGKDAVIPASLLLLKGNSKDHEEISFRRK